MTAWPMCSSSLAPSPMMCTPRIACDHAVEDELEPAGGVAADLAAGDLAVVSDADLVGDVLVGELLLGLADEADLGDGVDAVGVEAGIREHFVVAEGARGCDAALLHRDGSERREAR